jgi:hypothetical protein
MSQGAENKQVHGKGDIKGIECAPYSRQKQPGKTQNGNKLTAAMKKVLSPNSDTMIMVSDVKNASSCEHAVIE